MLAFFILNIPKNVPATGNCISRVIISQYKVNINSIPIPVFTGSLRVHYG